jgi:hypothetical protein
MEIFPSEYQQLDLNRHEKVFVRHAHNDKEYGFLLLRLNPAMVTGEYLHAVISSKGVILCKFLPLDNPTMFPIFMEPYQTGIIESSIAIIGQKLTSNKALLENNLLAVRVAFVCILPGLNKKDIDFSVMSPAVRNYAEYSCMFAESFAELRGTFADTMNEYLEHPALPHAAKCMDIADLNVNSILHRIAPEYTVVRFALKNDNNSTPGASEELLVVCEDDKAVRAFRLETDQINIVNKITKGDQLILACAGSGKSVLLIAKCFKAAKMNPEKRFLITCFNRNLQSLYTWFIERAGLTERNVDCLTFDGLCRKLILANNMFLPGGIDAIPARRAAAMSALRDGKIDNRYYGIFIDEVQMFEAPWYKFCYNLLENKDDEDHIFVVCGDKTQEIKQRQSRRKAPWQAGEGYPVFRGSNRNLRIEKNFRNCVEINEFINSFAQNARNMIQDHIPNEEFDPDMFLRGKAFRQGKGVYIKQIEGNALDEARLTIESIKHIHDHEHVPYDEIAVTFYNRQYKPMHYYIEAALTEAMDRAYIPYTKLYSSDEMWAGHFGDGGVSLITFESVLGLDFQAVVVCGIRPLGAYDKTKNLHAGKELDEEQAENLKKNISSLYVACTRAKDYLHIILSEMSNSSIFNMLLTNSN